MKTNQDSLNGILLVDCSGSQMVQQLWAFRKAIDPKFSLALIAKKIGFASRGTLSETIKGRRRWPRKYWKPLSKVLGLDGTQAELLIYLLERDECAGPLDRETMTHRIEGIRRFLRQRFFKVDLDHGLTLLASDVICYFGLHKDAPSERMIIEYFGRSRVMETLKALQVLLANGLIEKESDVYRRTEKTKSFLALHQDEASYSKTYIREAIQDAADQVPHWLFRQQESCFGSTTMSVKREQYEQVLLQIKKDVFRYFSELETNEGDMLIRFNMQIYPLQAP